MWNVAYKNDDSPFFVFKLCPLLLIFATFLFPEHNSGTIGNILMVCGMIIEQVSMECHMQE